MLGKCASTVAGAHTRERSALRNGLSSGEALPLAVEVASVRHRATVSSIVAPAVVCGGHTAEESDVLGKCASTITGAHTRERGAPRNGLSSGEALALTVEVASVRHRATVSSSGAKGCGGHTAEESDVLGKCASAITEAHA